ncbi:GL24645 [Gryllus bimaculatus]|nr:GL24645 [Gryllus bimaculatus]
MHRTRRRLRRDLPPDRHLHPNTRRLRLQGDARLHSQLLRSKRMGSHLQHGNQVAAPSTADVVEKKFDPRVFSSRAGRAWEVCTKAGAACDATCRRTGICMATGGAYAFRETSHCGERVCAPNSQELGCDMTGVYPDPYNCHNVLNCVAGRVASSVTICSEDTSYDSCTGFCDVILPGRQCFPQAPLCKFIGDFGTLPYNDRIYFYCVQDEEGLLHPVLGRCSQGYFDTETFSCTASEIPGCIRN